MKENEWIEIKSDGSNMPDEKDYTKIYEIGMKCGETIKSVNKPLHAFDFRNAYLHQDKISHFRIIPFKENPVLTNKPDSQETLVELASIANYPDHVEPDEYWYPNSAVREFQRKSFVTGYKEAMKEMKGFLFPNQQ